MTQTKILTYILEQLRLHGLSFLLLGAITYYFFTKVEALSEEVKACNNEVITVYREERNELSKVIERNTIALEKLERKD